MLRKIMKSPTIAACLIFSLFVLVMACSSVSNDSAIPNLEGTTWMQKDGQWVPEPGHGSWSTNTRVLHFGKSGHFKLLGWILYRHDNSDTILIGGEGGSTWEGAWIQTKDSAIVKYRLFHRTIPIVGETVPGPVMTDTAITVTVDSGLTELTFSGINYIPCTTLSERSTHMVSMSMNEDMVDSLKDSLTIR